MDPRLVLVQCISLTYREAQLPNKNSDSKELVREVLSTLRIPESAIDGDRTRESIVGLRGTLLYMLDNPSTEPYDREHLLQRIRINLSGDAEMFPIFDNGLRDLVDEAEIKKQVLRYREDLRQYQHQLRIKDILKRFYTKAHFPQTDNGDVDWAAFIPDLEAELGKVNTAQVTSVLQKPHITDSIDFSNCQSLVDVAKRAAEEVSVEGMLQCGWQGVNNMLGGEDPIRFRRGDFAVVGALQHNFKTGFTLNLFRHFCQYNKPYLFDKTKKPMMLHISAEDSATNNTLKLYQYLKENETKEPCDVTVFDPEEVGRYVQAKLTETGFHVHMLRINPTEFTYRDFYDIVLEFESRGYEIHACVFDYLNMISKRGCDQGATGADIRNLFRRIRNFTLPRGITFITPHQISSDAKKLLRSGVQPEKFVEEIANRGYWDSCGVIDQEVDIEFYLHKVLKDGVYYLNIGIGKHRRVGITPDKYKNIYIQFHDVAALPDDVNGTDTTLRKLTSAALDLDWMHTT